MVGPFLFKFSKIIKMKSYLLSFIFSALLWSSMSAQNIYSDIITSQAKQSATARINSDLQSYMSFMHPNIIEMGGGEESMRVIVEERMNSYKNMGVNIDKIDFGIPGFIVQAGEELHCVIPMTIHLSLGEDGFENPGNLLAVSADDGENWKFVDLSMYSKESLKTYFPAFNNSLDIPD